MIPIQRPWPTLHFCKILYHLQFLGIHTFVNFTKLPPGWPKMHPNWHRPLPSTQPYTFAVKMPPCKVFYNCNNWLRNRFDTRSHIVTEFLIKHGSNTVTSALGRWKLQKQEAMWLMAQLKEYVSAVLWMYDDLILSGWKVCSWMVQFCILIIFQNVIML